MITTVSRHLRFSDVAHAIGVTPTSLRLWLQRDLVPLHTPKPEHRCWASYSFADVAVLALTKALADFGIPVGIAGKFASAALDCFPEALDCPATLLPLLWNNRRLHLWRTGDVEWAMHLATLWESKHHVGEVLPSSVAELRREIEPAAVFISVDVEVVLRAAFERANERLGTTAERNDPPA